MSVGIIGTSGASDTTNYLMGRGKLHIAGLVAGVAEEWRDLGHVGEFTVNIEKEELEHFSSRAGLKVRDLYAIISQAAGGSFQMDELSAQNMAIFMSGASASEVNPAVLGITEYLAVTAVSGKGVWIDIKGATGIPARDLTATDVTVTHDKATANDTLVLNVDYTVDIKNGRIFLLPAGVVVLATKTIHITLAAKALAIATVDAVRGLTSSATAYALKFVGVNPLDADKEFSLDFHQVRFSADGDLALISDEMTSMPLSFAAEVNESWLDPDSQTVTLRTHVV